MSMLSEDVRKVWIVGIIAALIISLSLISGIVYYNLEMGRMYTKAGYTIDTVKGSAATYWTKPQRK